MFQKLFVMNARWSQDIKHKVANLAKKHRGYIKTDESMDVKWTKILEELQNDFEFKSECDGRKELSWRAIYQFFNRSMQDILHQLGISEEAVNLSGLPEDATDYMILMVNMAHEVYTKKKAISEEKERKEKKQKALLTHENQALSKQGTPNLGVILPNVSSDSTSPPSTELSVKSVKSSRSFADAFCSDITSQLQMPVEIIELEVEEKKQKLDSEKRRLDMEERRFQMEIDDRLERRNEAKAMREILSGMSVALNVFADYMKKNEEK
jgi:hypothetical protein